jgi:prophage regulatory protein
MPHALTNRQPPEHIAASSPKGLGASSDAAPKQRPAEADGLYYAGRGLSTRLLRFPEVRMRTGLSRSTIWRLERRGEFPQHRRISTNAVAWLEYEVVNWIQSRMPEPERR